MAYANSNKQLRKVLDLGGQVGGSLWVLDGVDAVASVDTISYITDGNAAGYNFRKGDILIYRRWTTTIPTADSEIITAAGTANIMLGVQLYTVIGVAATTGLPDLTDGTAISVTNTD